MRRQRTDAIFRAVADPTRRNILERLHERERTVRAFSYHAAIALKASRCAEAERADCRAPFWPSPLLPARSRTARTDRRMGCAVPRRQRPFRTRLAFDTN